MSAIRCNGNRGNAVRMMNLLLCCLLAVAALGCDSVELTIGVSQGAEGELRVSNANDTAWVDAHLLVEAVEPDNSATPCLDRTLAVWRPGEVVAVPACGGKVRLTLTTGGETARFAWANGQLFRRFGRKEVPVSSS